MNGLWNEINECKVLEQKIKAKLYDIENSIKVVLSDIKYDTWCEPIWTYIEDYPVKDEYRDIRDCLWELRHKRDILRQQLFECHEKIRNLKDQYRREHTMECYIPVTVDELIEQIHQNGCIRCIKF